MGIFKAASKRNGIRADGQAGNSDFEMAVLADRGRSGLSGGAVKWD